MIQLTFQDFDEMVRFARQLLGGQAGRDTEIVGISVEQPTPAQVPQTASASVTPTVTAQDAVPQAPAPTVVAAQPAASVPTSQASYTLDDLARAGMTLMDSGRQGDLLQLLARFGVDALPALPTAQYSAFAMALREMGAQI